MEKNTINKIKEAAALYCRDSKNYFSKSFEEHIEAAMIIGAALSANTTREKSDLSVPVEAHREEHERPS